MEKHDIIGINYGGNPCRALIAEVRNDKPVAPTVCNYSGRKTGMYCDTSENRYRQHPPDYRESLECAVKSTLSGRDKKATIRVGRYNFRYHCKHIRASMPQTVCIMYLRRHRNFTV